MAASIAIETEQGTYVGGVEHPHNGYYAGDFSQVPVCPAPSAHRSPTQIQATKRSP